jgi:hypothetical protein
VGEDEHVVSAAKIEESDEGEDEGDAAVESDAVTDIIPESDGNV